MFESDNDPLDAAKGILLGVVLGVVLYGIAYLIAGVLL